MKKIVYLFLMLLLSLSSGEVYAQKKPKKKKKKQPEAPLVLNEEQKHQQMLKITEINELYVEACTQLIAGELTSAKSIFRQVLVQDPKNHACHYNLARIAVATASSPMDYDLAIAEADTAILGNPQNYWYYVVQVDAYKQKGDYNNAIRVQNNVTKLFAADHPNAWMTLSDLYKKKGDYLKAISALDQLRKQKTFNNDISLNIVKLYQEAGKYEEALNEVKQLIQRHPAEEFYAIEYNILVTLGRKEEGVKVLEEMLERYPSDGFSLITLAEYYKSIGNYEKSDKYLFQAFMNPRVPLEGKENVVIAFMDGVQSAPEQMPRLKKLMSILNDVHGEDPSVMAIQADVWVIEGKYDSAYTYYRKVLEQDRTILHVWEQLIQMDAQRKDFVSMEKDAMEAVGTFPNNESLRIRLGHARIALNQTEKAKLDFEKSIRKATNPTVRALANMGMAEALFQEGQVEQADLKYAEGYDIYTNNPEIQQTYAWYLARRSSQLELASELIEAALKAQPASGLCWHTKGWIYYQKKDYKEAQAALEKALTFSPNDAEILEHLGDTFLKLGKNNLANEYWQKAIQAGAKFDLKEKQL